MQIRTTKDEEKRHTAVAAHKMGAVYFVALRGLLGWGLPMFVFFIAFGYFVMGRHNMISLAMLIATGLFCAVAGMIWGAVMWLTLRSRLKKAQ